jgi:hypothetical protein
LFPVGWSILSRGLTDEDWVTPKTRLWRHLETLPRILTGKGGFPSFVARVRDSVEMPDEPGVVLGFRLLMAGDFRCDRDLPDGGLVGRRVAVVDGFAVALPVQSLREVLDRPVEGRFS